MRLLRVKAVQNALVLTFSLGLTLAGSDILLRVAGEGLLYFRPEDRWMNRWPPLPSQTRLVPNATFEGEVFGDLAGLTAEASYQERRRVTFRTDEFGFRNAPGSAKRPLDLLLLGDSFGLGFGVSQDKTWASLFASRYGLKTYNLSTGGSPWNEYLNMKTEIGRLKTSPGCVLVWALYSGNDLEGEYGSLEPAYAPMSERWKTRYATFLDRSPLRLILSRLRYYVQAKKNPHPELLFKNLPDGKPMLFLRSSATAEAVSLEDRKNHPHYPELKKVFAAMKRLADSNRLRVVVVGVPTKEGVYSRFLDAAMVVAAGRAPSGFSEMVSELCAEQGFHYVDLKPDMRALAEKDGGTVEGLLWWRDDTHWNNRGHEAAADIVYEKGLRVLTDAQ